MNDADDGSDRRATLEERVPENIDNLAEFANLVQRVLREVAGTVQELRGVELSPRLQVDLDRLEELAHLFL